MTLTAFALTVVASCFAVVAMNGVPALWAVVFALMAVAVVLMLSKSWRTERALIEAEASVKAADIDATMARIAIMRLAHEWAMTIRPETAGRRAAEWRARQAPHADLVAEQLEARAGQGVTS